MTQATTKAGVDWSLVGRELDPSVRERVLALGHAAVPELVEVLEDEAMSEPGGPGDGWAPNHAVELLIDLKADVVPELLAVLLDTTFDHIIHDVLIRRMPELGAAIVEPCLECFEAELDEEQTHSVCCVLAAAGVRDERIFRVLSDFAAAEPDLGCALLADYGDPRALPLIEDAIMKFEPVGAFAFVVLNELVDTHRRLGGVMNDGLRAILAREYRAAGKTPERNEPCFCGSGLKYKKCCLGR